MSIGVILKISISAFTLVYFLFPHLFISLTVLVKIINSDDEVESWHLFELLKKHSLIFIIASVVFIILGTEFIEMFKYIFHDIF